MRLMLGTQLDPHQLIVVADFDGTFTKKEIDGKKTSALMTVLQDEKYLGVNGKADCQALFEHYYPIELDPSLSVEAKSELMQEWWEKTYAVFKREKVSKEMFLEVCDSPFLQWRDDLLTFLQLLAQKSIPLVIFSAGGFGKLAIEYLLGKAGVLTDNIQVFSNQIIFDQDGFFQEPVKPIVHIANKTGAFLINNHLLESKPSRRQCLLIGDTLEDANMVKGIDFDLVYKVAFSDHNQDHFQEKFDLVLPKTGSYQPIIDLLD